MHTVFARVTIAPWKATMPTKHRTIRLTDEDWQGLIDAFSKIVPDDRKPAHARDTDNWQVVEGLRMIASGEILLMVADKVK